MRATRGATIADVARLAGVSPATVSRVMNRHPAVTPATDERVRKAADQLDYVPSNAARSLSLGRTRTVALVMPDLSDPMFQQVLRGVNRAAARDGYRVFVADSIEDPEREAELALEARQRCDALILVSPRMPPKELRRVLSAAEPVVLINRDTEAGGTTAISVDYAEGTRVLLERLTRLGHKRFLYLCGPPDSVTDRMRIRALRALLRDTPDLSVEFVPCGGRIEDGYAALGPVLESRATAVLAYNDIVAFGLLGKLNEAGVNVPSDLSVAGFDDIEFARYSSPSLTTMSVPKEELGRHAWEETHRILSGSGEASDMSFQPRLVERGSTGPVPREPMDVLPPEVAHQVPFGWHRDGDDVVATLEFNGVTLTRYERRPVMPDVFSPRPYLHPIHTLGAVLLSDANPPLHRHQHGLSLALPSVNGTSYWGGRTHTPDAGPVLLANHGSQLSQSATITGAVLDERLLWHAQDGVTQLAETRSLTGWLTPGGDGWGLTWRSELRAVSGPVRIESPALAGRVDAGYGGIFWRFPSPDGVRLSVAEGDGPDVAHDSRSPWLLLSHPDGEPWSVLLCQAGGSDPWHVRAEQYLAVGPAIAWHAPLEIAAGATHPIGLRMLALDRAVEATEVPELLEQMAAAG